MKPRTIILIGGSHHNNILRYFFSLSIYNILKGWTIVPSFDNKLDTDVGLYII